LGLPHARKRWFIQLPPYPWEKSATASGPYSALTFRKFSATTFRASSQLLEHLAPPPVHAHQRLLQPVGIVEQARASRSPRAEVAS